jgi:hypothetical protein
VAVRSAPRREAALIFRVRMTGSDASFPWALPSIYGLWGWRHSPQATAHRVTWHLVPCVIRDR